MKIILASASPRRRRLLEEAGIEFAVAPADVPEVRPPGEAPEAYALRLAREKAAAVAQNAPDAVVIGADTVVVLGQDVLEKPADFAEARRMLGALSGKTHRVITGVCLLRREPFHEDAWTTTSRVTFRRLSETDIDRYLSLIDPLDKAGAYAVQEYGDLIVERVDGSLTNVIGLPVEEVVARLQAFRDN